MFVCVYNTTSGIFLHSMNRINHACRMRSEFLIIARLTITAIMKRKCRINLKIFHAYVDLNCGWREIACEQYREITSLRCISRPVYRPRPLSKDILHAYKKSHKVIYIVAPLVDIINA